MIEPALADLQTTDNGPIELWAAGFVTLNDGDADVISLRLTQKF